MICKLYLHCLNGHLYRHFFLLLLILLPGAASFAQDHATGKISEIRGKVIDTSGNPVIGASVAIKGTKSGTATKEDGSFILTTSLPSGTLTITYVGYEIKEVAFPGKANQVITLNAKIEAAAEVVVIGYGTQKRKDLTGSVSSISPKDYQQQPVLDVSTALQGRAAGVAVTNTSGAPGAVPKIRIRGANSINTSNDPLYIVDGIALASNGLNAVNVNDIVSMDILKDASATAIYGSRGANGVVVITTKKGTAGPAKVSYDVFLSIAAPIKKYNLMDRATYARIANLVSPGIFTNPDTLTGKGVDMQDWVYAKRPLTQNHQLSVTGGTDKIKYYVSGFYQDQNGIVINTANKTFGLRANLNGKITDRLSFNLNMFTRRINQHNPNSGLDYNSFLWPPTEPVYTDPANGIYNRRGTHIIVPNPYMGLKEANKDVFQNVSLLTGSATYKITDWLSFTTNVGLDANTSKTAYLNNDWILQGNPGSGNEYAESYAIQNSNVLTFHKIYGSKHDLTGTAVFENTKTTSSGFNATGSKLASLVNGYYNLGLNASQTIGSKYSNWSQLSYVGRVSYTYDRRYLLTATLRRDGSSKFQGANKWGNFPSVGFGWNITEESFAKNQTMFSHLKIRGGWGITGNDRIDPYSTLGLLSQDQYAYGSPTPYIAYFVGNPATPDIKWETSRQTDVGIEMGFLNDRINITADYYNKNTNNLLLLTPIANYNGGGSLLKNIGEVNNKGLELGANATIIETKDFRWNAFANVSYNKNKVVSLGADSMVLFAQGGIISSQIQALKVGQPMGSFYLLKWAGIYQQDEKTLGYKAGDNHFVDAAGNNVLGGGNDQMVIGNAMPKYQLGFGSDFTYKNLSLNIYIQGAYGYKIFNQTYGVISSITSASSFGYYTLADAANYWTPSNTSSEWPVPGSSTNNTKLYSSHYLQDGSYTRLKNIGLTYKLPHFHKSIAEASISASAQNILTLTKYKGLDPEVPAGTADDTKSGIDFGAYPSPKTYTIRLGIVF